MYLLVVALYMLEFCRIDECVNSMYEFAKEVTFSSAFACLLAYLLAGLCKNYSADSHKIKWRVTRVGQGGNDLIFVAILITLS